MKEVVPLQPLHDLIVVAIDESAKKTASGILIHETWKDLPPTGTVSAVGPDVTHVKPGDRILFSRYSAVQIGEQFGEEDKGARMIKEEHVWAIITDPNARVSYNNG